MTLQQMPNVSFHERVIHPSQTWRDLSFEHDIWAAANFLVKKYGEYAEIIAGVHHDELREQGHTEEAMVLKRVRTAVRELLSDVVPWDGTVH